MSLNRFKLVVDGRKSFDSGVGAVIRNCLFEFSKASIRGKVICSSIEDADRLKVICPEWDIVATKTTGYSVKEQCELPRLLRGNDVAWIPHYNIPIVTGVPLVTTIHDIIPLALPQFFPGLAKQLYAHLMFRAAVRKSRVVVSVSQFTANELVRIVKCDSRKIRVIPNGVAQEWSEFAPNHDTSQKYLLFVGNVKETKNIQRLISSFARVQGQILHRLVIVGKSEGFITSDKSAVKGAEDLNARVTFTGSVSQEVLRKYMRGASGFVFPSLYEGFGLPPLEAMAAGIPVAASNTSAIPEVCGDCAIYFDPYDEHSIASALVRLAGLNGLEKQSFVEKGRRRAQTFTWNETASQLAEAFREAVL